MKGITLFLTFWFVSHVRSVTVGGYKVSARVTLNDEMPLLLLKHRSFTSHAAAEAAWPNSVILPQSYVSHTYDSSASSTFVVNPLSSRDCTLPPPSCISHPFGSSAPTSLEPLVSPSATVSNSTIADNQNSSTAESQVIHAAQLNIANNDDGSLLSSSQVVSPSPSSQNLAESSTVSNTASSYTESASITSIIAPKETITIHADAISTLITNGTQRLVIITKEKDPKKNMRPCYRGKKKVAFSQYWIPKENEWDETSNGKRVFLGGNIRTTLLNKDKKVIGKVPIDLYGKCKMEGTCLLENGDLINIDNSTKSFIKVGGAGREHNVFGLGSGPQNLVPFVSVAANDIPYGQKLYIEELDGLDLGGKQKHNGCVRVDDDSWSFNGCQIDFFVLSYVDYLWLDLEEKVSIKYDDHCTLKNYVTQQHLHMVKASTNEKIIPSLTEAKYVKINK